MSKRFRISNSVIYLSTVIIMIIAKIIKIYLLDSNFFYDSKLLLEIMNNSLGANNSNYNYDFAANVYNFLNFFKINDVLVFDLIFGVFFTVVIVIVEKNLLSGYYSFVELIFLFMLVFFSNIYTFSLSKDLIQFVLISLFVFFVTKFNRFIPLFLIPLIPIFIIAYFLRNYFYAVICLYVLFFVCFSKIRNKKNILFSIILGIFALLLAIYFLQEINPNIYKEILRSNELYSSKEANSKIVNILGNTNFMNFAINYIINLFRLLFPFELLTKGIYYYVFVAYQLILLFILYKSVKKNYTNKKIMILLSMIVSHYLVCVLFEPDFGSFLRHQISMSIVYLPIIFYEWTGEQNELCLEFCNN